MGTDQPSIKPELLESLEWRSIGPPRGGRVVAVAGHPTEPAVFYFGACSGGVWKTDDGGTYWQNVSDGYFNTAPVGAIAVSESDPNVIYAGTGEACIRGNVSHGDGVYKSTDGGATWQHVGLTETRHISRIRIHPRDPDVAYVAALGRAFGSNEERGVYRTKDGGGSWERVLYRSENAGACDLSMDPNNPRILFAGIWQALREPWTLTSGGPDSGLFRSADGGDTWEEITGNKGLPEGLKGRIGVSVSPARSGRVWALIESKDHGGLYRSEDGGSSWELVSDDDALRQRPWYYTHVFAHPTDPETVHVLALKALRSTDGGRTFTQVTLPHGDNHDLWIDPADPKRMIEGNDGGACVSFNEGESWSTIYNQATSQFYRMATDNEFPYRVYATQQDNSAISVPSRSTKGAIVWGDCYAVGSSESGQIAVRPDNANIVYSGAIGSSPGGGDSLLRYDHSTGQVRIITVWPEFYWGHGVNEHKYRFQWTYPITISPHDPNVLYVAGNVAFRTDDEGSSWEVISPDLTRNDASKGEASGGPITLDTTYVEHYGTIFAFVESPLQAGVFWAGSDDGLVHISRDGGDSWDNVTPPEMPEWSLINLIEPSPHNPAAAYIAANRYKLDDTRPYLYKTNDYGETWVEITTGIPGDDFTRVIREDPARRGLLYAGTEGGIFVSVDDGASWQSLQRNLPAVPVHDLAVKGNELVAATHGRSFWILDDLTVLHQLAAEETEGSARILKPADTLRPPPGVDSGRQIGEGKNYQLALGATATFYESEKPNGEKLRTFLDAGANPPEGVVVTYYLAEKPEGEVTLTFLDANGGEIKGFSNNGPEKGEKKDGPKEVAVPAEAGMNRFNWDMKYPEARNVDIEDAWKRGLAGPLAPPGAYQVRLTVGDYSGTQSFELYKDPRVSTTQEDLDAQHALLIRLRDKITETNDAINRSGGIRRQVDEWVARSKDKGAPEEFSQSADGVKEKLEEIEGELIQRSTLSELNRIQSPSRISEKLRELTFVIASADASPTKQSYEAFEDFSARADAQIKRIQEVIDTDLDAFINQVHELEIPAIVP